MFPQTMAMGYIHMGTMAGKLKGVIPAHTPTGWRMVSQSIPLATCSRESPMSRVGAPQANSTTSIPRRTDPRASSRVLPCSRVTRRDNASKFSSRRCTYLNRIRARSTTGVSDQPGSAARAARTAESTSASPHMGVLAMTLPSEGLKTGSVVPSGAAVQLPLMNRGMVLTPFSVIVFLK